MVDTPFPTSTKPLLADSVARVIISDIRKNFPNIYGTYNGLSDMASFNLRRAQQFYGRVMQAQDGHEEAIRWANDYYCQLYDEAYSEMQVAMQSQCVATEFFRRRARDATELIAAGNSENPIFKAYLDTVENPEMTKGRNSDFFQWHGHRIAEYRQTQSTMTLEAFIRQYADAHLAERVIQKRGAQA